MCNLEDSHRSRSIATGFLTTAASPEKLGRFHLQQQRGHTPGNPTPILHLPKKISHQQQSSEQISQQQRRRRRFRFKHQQQQQLLRRSSSSHFSRSQAILIQSLRFQYTRSHISTSFYAGAEDLIPALFDRAGSVSDT
ncbi:hypothetical protein L6452_39045 [Arctium lappa]|uniref:Uncharacterized protein n=1 Tax=Arctium lappa TaxID=4217 RepID=A0ACB8XRV2_ARCLA|nr:hypothetical protein L6452_39045 [Arctium lappa]